MIIIYPTRKNDKIYCIFNNIKNKILFVYKYYSDTNKTY